jgi:thiol-disulfide isomerase/thioredoxin
MQYRSAFILFLLFSFSFLIGQSQNVTIKGKVDRSYLSLTDSIYAYTYEDYISYAEKELAKCKLDSAGNFSLHFSALQPTYLFLLADNAKAEIVCEPGKAYDISFLPKDSNAVNTLSITIPVAIEFNNSNETELNYLLADFDGRLEAFLQDHRGMIAKKERGVIGKVDTLKRLFKNKYAAYNNAYLNNHIEYAFAALEDNLMLRSKGAIFESYISNRTIQESNYDYMTFFHQFYSPLTDAYMKSGKVEMEINSKQVFTSLAMHYKNNFFLKNDTLCEMAVLKSLSEYYRYPDAYKTNAILAVLEQAKMQCISPMNKKSASYLKDKLSVMAVGTIPSQINFEDKDGNLISLSKYAGKYIYITFWTSWSSISTQELTLLPELKKQFGNKIVFVSICLDKRKEPMLAFINKNPKYDWNFLYCNNYKKVKEQFKVLTVPTYYFLDQKGKVLLSPAPGPTDIEPVFIKIKKKQH